MRKPCFFHIICADCAACPSALHGARGHVHVVFALNGLTHTIAKNIFPPLSKVPVLENIIVTFNLDMFSQEDSEPEDSSDEDELLEKTTARATVERKRARLVLADSSDEEGAHLSSPSKRL